MNRVPSGRDDVVTAHLNRLTSNENAPCANAQGAFSRGAGDGLLSRGLSTGVPSALSGLTTVFGMGTGVALTL